MQVVMCEANGGPENLVVKSVDSPSPGPGEVKIRLRARGVSFTDVLRIAGLRERMIQLRVLQAALVVRRRKREECTVAAGELEHRRSGHR